MKLIEIDLGDKSLTKIDRSMIRKNVNVKKVDLNNIAILPDDYLNPGQQLDRLILRQIWFERTYRHGMHFVLTFPEELLVLSRQIVRKKKTFNFSLVIPQAANGLNMKTTKLLA